MVADGGSLNRVACTNCHGPTANGPYKTVSHTPEQIGGFSDDQLPASVELTVTDTEPGLQGDRVSGARKPATMETGLVVQVPLFVNVGEKLKIDTRSGEYLTRA